MRTRLSICARKARYTSGPDAYRAAAAATIELRPYRCDRCRQFHLTSRTKGKRVLRPAGSSACVAGAALLHAGPGGVGSND